MGVRVAFCEHCGDKIEDVIPKLGSTEEGSDNSDVADEGSMNENDGSSGNNSTSDGKNYDPVEGSSCSSAIGGGVIGGLLLTGVCIALRKKERE